MNVKEAVRAANKYITELFADEEVQDRSTDFAVFDRVAEAFKDVDDLSAKIDQAVDESKAAHNRPVTSQPTPRDGA